MTKLLNGFIVVLSLLIAMAALKLLLPSAAKIIGGVLVALGLVAIFRPIPQVGLRSRALAVVLVLFIAPMGFLDPPNGADLRAPSEPRQTIEQRQAEEARIRRERANQEREERQATGAAKLARLCGEDNAIAADVWSLTFVKRELKSPSSASFPWSGKSKAIGNCMFRVVSYVEAKNSFGATTRTYYEAKLRYDPVADKWTLISLRFEDRYGARSIGQESSTCSLVLMNVSMQTNLLRAGKSASELLPNTIRATRENSLTY